MTVLYHTSEPSPKKENTWQQLLSSLCSYGDSCHGNTGGYYGDI